jgi:hypothetical protein
MAAGLPTDVPPNFITSVRAMLSRLSSKQKRGAARLRVVC